MRASQPIHLANPEYALGGRPRLEGVAAIDVAGFVTDLKDHAVDHGFHVHDERHFVETYSLRQWWEVDLHPEEGCGQPVDLHLALDVDPRVLLAFEDTVATLPEDADPPDDFHFPLTFTWSLPPLAIDTDILRIAVELAGVTGTALPLEVAATDVVSAPTEAPERRLVITARWAVSLARIVTGKESLCELFDRSREVSLYLLDHYSAWQVDERDEP
jgi:hypothetical protein